MEYNARTRISIAANGTVTGGTFTPQALMSTPPMLPPNTGVVPYLPDGQEYVIDTATSLSANAAIILNNDPLITPFPGMTYKFRYMGQIATFTNAATVTILGLTLTSAQAGQQLNIVCEYALSNETNTAQWIYWVSPLEPDATYVAGVNNLAITLAGATKTLVSGTDNTIQYIATSGSLTGSWSLTGTPLNGAGKFTVAYNGTITIGAYALTIFGYTLTAAQAKQQLTINAVYDSGNSAWVTTVTAGLPSQAVNYIGVGTYTITGAAQVSQTLTPGVSHQTFALLSSGVVSLSGNYAISLATPSEECSFQIMVPAQINIGVYTLTIGGIVISAQMAQQGGYSVFAWWDSTASVWRTQLIPPFSGQNQVYTVKVVLSNTQCLALATPQVLVAAPGAGLMIDPIDVMGAVNYATAAFATYTALYIGHNNGSPSPYFYSDTTLLPATGNLTPKKLTPKVYGDSSTNQTTANTALTAWALGNPTAGGGSISLYIQFMIVAL